MKRAALIAGVAALLLGACSRAELYRGLSEREANEMLAVVESAGLTASKSTKDGETWSLSTSQPDFPEAVALLQARGYPKERFESLGEVFKKSGFVSSPLEERARLIYGLSQELSDTISSIDGVVAARVHLAVPESDPLAQTKQPSSASVFIKHDPATDLSGQVAPIKALVVNSIEGLPYDRVTVVLVPAKPLTLAPSPRRAVRADLSLTVLLAVAGGAAAFVAWRRNRRSRRTAVAPAGLP